ncbi:multiprotein bridging factor aMBF1 [Picrophilus oshimae]|uniref:HTH DNA binding protein n=1 Tax=Picrophilus torridus (strain ATCC 700027 / DSM 9790 / JCM 10055 / NBRC 100828 / KAW 2/3) TaxID=1122961 RepID=Q6KZQ6_PICTO|nr:multiprotein bridging factor aMBF1 [Picrophilus oshimae]AAT43796.1 HTH DNA binding protein [Picrophilus oshimae DSM 9789]
MECEMCGRNVPQLKRVRVSGAIMNVCPACARFGEPVDEPRKQEIKEDIKVKIPEKKIIVKTYKKPYKKYKRPAGDDVESLDIVEDYASLIKSARERLSMTQEDLARKVLERKNVISNIERGDLLPSIETAKKLEKVLGIKLIETEY